MTAREPAVGFIPAAPLLVPAVAGGSAHLDAELREACREVGRRLVASSADRISVVAPAGPVARSTAGATWGFEGFGVARDPADPRPRLPWPLGLGDWLLDEAGWSGARNYIEVSADALAAGSIADADAVLVVGDGSARRTEKAPGHLDDRAEAFDAGIAACVRAGDLAGLGDLDAELATELMCAGASVWRWLAQALAGRRVVAAELLAEAAPYGVGYFAGWWRLTMEA